MEKIRKIIGEKKGEFPEFGYYHNIIDKIEENIEKMPDIAIESCKSLVEGVSKTILNKLGVAYSENGRNIDNPKDLLKKALVNIPIPTSHDPEFITRVCELIARMSEIRNTRGDISHGRLSPKEIDSDANLAKFIAEITDSVGHYLLYIYFNADLSYLEKVKYEDNEEFNQSLDDGYQLGESILYSKALFDQDQISYEEQLNNYLQNKEEQEI